ncbi:amidase family protein [Roseomonas haemaphysalidis]|uniref:Amidase n=1 Tax=Roseomonas haemaphysalidis TaxID=2768162 RepID=A0ABS3KS67_9PROT|nr:amidase family protein [Roseomonas haemaphysalidis]MBO1080310.1 amidase [Roseomonas haemaphysalidis]
MSDTDPALMSAEQLLALYARRRLSPVEALQAVMERVARFNPWVNAFSQLNPRALADAGASTARWAAGRPLGPLDGVPVTVKDSLDLQGFPTRHGSKTTATAAATEDAPAVLGLKGAGAVMLGKTHTTEFEWKTPGDNPPGGITRNAWNPERSVGGSSSGAGAAGAANFGPLHLGSDSGGGIRVPAAWCGLVGLKPSQGRVPQWPRATFGTLSSAGPMARSVRDAALMLSAMAQADLRDPSALPDDARDWRGGIEDGVAGLRVAVVRRPGFMPPIDAEGEASVELAARLLREQGAIVEGADPDVPDLRDAFALLRGVALARRVAGIAPDRRPLLDGGLEETAQRAEGLSALDYLAAEALRMEAAHAMARFHQRYDLVLCPTTPSAAFAADAPTIRPREALWRDWLPWTAVFSMTGQPAISVPAGMDESGMPRGVQLAAARLRDDLVLRGARAIERAVALPPARTEQPEQPEQPQGCAHHAH